MADGLNNEMSWPPTRVFYEEYSPEDQFSSKVQSQRHHLHWPDVIKSPASQPPPLLHPITSSKPCWKPRPRTSTGAVGGPGMQAVFLNSTSRQKSCGTGVFLPRIAGTELRSTNKRAFSPVLLPSRVVQALNLNVHELGLQIKPRDGKNNSKEGLDRGINRKKKASEVTPSQSCVISKNHSSSPEIFLPKEWTY